MNLTESQKQFLLSTFFESDKYPGSRSIGDKLLTNGKVIVAGDKCIWIGELEISYKLKKLPKQLVVLNIILILTHFYHLIGLKK